MPPTVRLRWQAVSIEYCVLQFGGCVAHNNRRAGRIDSFGTNRLRKEQLLIHKMAELSASISHFDWRIVANNSDNLTYSCEFQLNLRSFCATHWDSPKSKQDADSPDFAISINLRPVF